jgi:hypothetical protein
MKAVSGEHAAIKERLVRLERQNKRLTLLLVVITLPLLGFLVMGAKMGATDGRFRHLVAQELAIVDSSGEELVVIGSGEDYGTGMRIMGAGGKRAVGIGVTADGDGRGILVTDTEGSPRIVIGMDGDKSRVAVLDTEGNAAMTMCAACPK